jgi:hypothetical protein
MRFLVCVLALVTVEAQVLWEQVINPNITIGVIWAH